jgi:hypothetical protein
MSIMVFGPLMIENKAAVSFVITKTINFSVTLVIELNYTFWNSNSCEKLRGRVIQSFHVLWPSSDQSHRIDVSKTLINFPSAVSMGSPVVKTKVLFVYQRWIIMGQQC